MGKTALYAGSFDPLTLGHMDIIERAGELFDAVVVAVVANPGKSSLFTVDERLEMLRDACKDMTGVKVDSFVGLLADYVNENRFDAVVRGLRNTTDFEYEEMMANVNADLYKNNTQTVFLMTKPELSYVSSSMVKEVASLGGDISSYVSKDIEEKVITRYRRNN